MSDLANDTNVPINDCISRQAAIKAATYGNPQTAWQRIEALPSVRSERKKGKWMHDKDDILCSGYCSCCGWLSIILETDVADMPYCPNCGADMRGET